MIESEGNRLNAELTNTGMWNMESQPICLMLGSLGSILEGVLIFKSRDRQEKLPNFYYLLQINVLNLAPSSPAVGWSTETVSRKSDWLCYVCSFFFFFFFIMK